MKQRALAKGTNFTTSMRTLSRLRGHAAVEATLRALSGELGDVLRYGGLVPSGWYPASWYRDLHTAAESVCHGGLDFARAIGRQNTIDDFQGIYRIVVAVFSPETIFQQSTRLMGMYWQGGTTKTVYVKKGSGRVRFEGWSDFDPNVWADITGSLEGLLSVCGAREIRTRTVAGGNHEGFLDVVAQWTSP
jgi:hypothetical protein